MPEIYPKLDNQHLGHISDDDLKFLIDQLEEEGENDEDYAITPMALEYMNGQGMSASLQAVLEAALGPLEEVEIKYTRS
jgi:hypothetical protein